LLVDAFLVPIAEFEMITVLPSEGRLWWLEEYTHVLLRQVQTYHRVSPWIGRGETESRISGILKHQPCMSFSEVRLPLLSAID